MNIKALLYSAALLLSLCGQQVMAAELTIHAEYKAGFNGQPQNMEFTDITQCRGYWCNYMGISKDKRLLVNSVVARPLYLSSDPRKNLYLQFPGSRTVTVRHNNGSTADLTFTLTAIGGIYRRINNYQPHLYELTENLRFPEGACSSNGANVHRGAWDTAFIWTILPEAQQNGGTCIKKVNSRYQTNYKYWQTQRHLLITYRLQTPNPLTMDNGAYRGRLVFSVGPNGDFDYGDIEDGVYRDSEIIINFELSVGHHALFKFPADGTKASLEPPSGWAQYLNRGIVPDRVEYSMPFSVWNNVPLTVYLQCQYRIGSDCALKNTRNSHTVPVKTSITLPGQLTQQNGAAINRTLLREGNINPHRFKLNATTLNGRGELYFQVQKNALAEMLKNYTGDLYQGDVTLVVEPQFPD